MKTEAQKEASARNLRPHSFKKGVSGNPKGKPAIPDDVKEAAKAHTLLAIETLVDVMRNGKNEASRVQAATSMLNRGWGQPKQTVDATLTVSEDWTSMLDALEAYKAAKQIDAPAPVVIDAVVVEEEAE